MITHRDSHLNFFEQRQKAFVNEVRADFDFEETLHRFIDTKYPLHIDRFADMNAEYKQAVANMNTEKLATLAQYLEGHISDIRPKSRDDVEQKKNLIKMEILLQELKRVTADGEE